MTEHQQKHGRVFMKLFPKSPRRAVPRPQVGLSASSNTLARFERCELAPLCPQNKCQAGVFDVINTSSYELAMAVIICLNVVVVTLESAATSETMYNVLAYADLTFIIIFLLEFIFKVVAFRQHYFKDGWNMVDFIILPIQITGRFSARRPKVHPTILLKPSLSLPGLFIGDLLWLYFWPPSIFVYLRLFRLCRVLHVFPVTRSLRKVLLALVKSVPALFNIAFVLLLVTAVFSLIGMFNFAYVKGGAIDDLFNFETFCSGVVCLFMTSTTAEWGGLLLPILRRPPDCDPFVEEPGTGAVGDCSSPTLGVAFFAAYIFLTFLLLVQLYITVVMEIINSEDTEELCDDDLENFCATWMKFDPDGTQLIPYR